jgi:tRNA-dihydrouridine synthase
MRLGFDATSLNAPELARRCEAAGARLVAVHGRTRAQFYDGDADWTAVAEVKRATTIPVIVNGDVASAADARDALSRSGADGVMIGRAALGRPWLPGEIARDLRGGAKPVLSFAVRGDLAIAHYRGLLELYGVSLGLRHARKHVQAYAAHALVGWTDPRASMLKSALVRSEQPEQVEAMLREAFKLAGDVGDRREAVAA